MSYKKENLEKLVLLIENICSSNDNKWFKEKLLIVLNSETTITISTNEGDFGSYFKLLKKQFKIKANKFYENIKDTKLKNQLVTDCIKMYWFQVNNDVNQLFVFAFFQMENMLNYYAHNSNCFEKITSNKNYYSHYFNEKFSISASLSFLNTDNTPKPISKINIWPKIVYWAYDTGRVDFLQKQTSNFSNLINIRNENNHRNSENIALEKFGLDFVRVNDFSSFGFYINILKEIIKSLENINIQVESKSFQTTKVKLVGPKILGKIDLDNNKK
jgi:hypothetical protein